MNSKALLHFVVLIGLWSAIFIAPIARPALLDDADSFHAEAVREMVQSGDWVTLRINNGIRYLEKAPFMYWLAALSVTAFGASRLGHTAAPCAVFSPVDPYWSSGSGCEILGRKSRLLLGARDCNFSRPLTHSPGYFCPT